VAFVREAVQVGARSHVSVRARSRALDAQGAPGGEQDSVYESELDVEVLAASGGASSRVRVRFARNVQIYQGAQTPTEIDGKTYVVDVRAPFVRDERGAAVPEGETEHVLDVFSELGTRARVDQALPDGSMTIGDACPALAQAVLHVIHPRAWVLDDGGATLSTVEGGEAVFDVRIEGHATSRTMPIRMAGAVRVRLRGASLASILLRGTYPDGTFEYTRSVTLVGRATDR
jgi:hypothetical protein